MVEMRVETYVPLHEKCPSVLYDFNEKWYFPTTFSKSLAYVVFKKRSNDIRTDIRSQGSVPQVSRCRINVGL
jgi:hypothetical protein